MNKQTTRFLALGVLISLLGSFNGIPAYGQGGSNYSAFGYGDILEHSSAVYTGLGGTALAVRSPYAINSMNPAAWGYVESTRLQVTYLFQQFHIDDGSNALSQNNGKILGVNSILSIDTTLGIGVSFGIRPYSTVNYLFQTSETVDFDGTILHADSEYLGEGGLSMMYLGAAFRPLDKLSVGVSASYYFGTISSKVQTTISGANFFFTRVTESDKFSGAGVDIGLMYELTPKLTLGLSVSANGSLSRDNEIEHLGLDSNVVINNTGESPMPLRIGLGASYETGEFIYSADIVTTDFSDLDYRSNTGRTSFRRSNRYSLGVQWLGTTARHKRYLEQWTLNMGFGFQQHYYEVAGSGIDELYASAGVQIPVTSRSYLDLSLTGGTRGTTDNGLVSELFGKLGVSLSMGDSWFKPFRQQ